MENLVELPDSQYLWLLGPQCLLLLWSYQLFLLKGWRGLHGPVAGVLFLVGFITHFCLMSVVKVHEMDFWPEIGPVLYSLCFNLYQLLCNGLPEFGHSYSFFRTISRYLGRSFI